MKTTRPLADRFVVKISLPSDMNNCWLWKGAKNDKGYGQMRICANGTKKTFYAHRIAWYVFFGAWPAPHECVCHMCDTPLCVNPFHLFIGSKKDNHADMVSKGRAKYTPLRGEENGNRKLDNKKVVKIRKLAGTMTHKEIAEMFGVHKSLISLVINRKVWAHI